MYRNLKQLPERRLNNMAHNTYIYILIMAGVSFLIRVLPMTLIRKKIENRFIRSFLYYVPYVTLTVMTVPAIIFATSSVIAGVLALIVGVFMAWKGANLIQVASTCCLIVFIVELILSVI